MSNCNFNLTYGNNKHQVLCIVMDEITKFIAHMCHEPQPTAWEKPDSLIVLVRGPG